MMITNRGEMVAAIARLMLDRARIDRYVRVADDGHAYLTDAECYIGNNGPYNTPSVKVPVIEEYEEGDLEIEAEAILDRLEEECEEAGSQD